MKAEKLYLWKITFKVNKKAKNMYFHTKNLIFFHSKSDFSRWKNGNIKSFKRIIPHFLCLTRFAVSHTLKFDFYK